MSRCLLLAESGVDPAPSRLRAVTGENSCLVSQMGWGLPKRFPEPSPRSRAERPGHHFQPTPGLAGLQNSGAGGRGGGASLQGRSHPRPLPPPRGLLVRWEKACDSPAPRRRVLREQTGPGVRPAGGDTQYGWETGFIFPPEPRASALAPVIHLAVPEGPAPASRQLSNPTDSSFAASSELSPPEPRPPTPPSQPPWHPHCPRQLRCGILQGSRHRSP